MAHHELQIERIQLLVILVQGVDIGSAEAEPCHPGVDLQDGRQPRASGQGRGGPTVHLIRTAEHRHKIVGDEVSFRAGKRPMQDSDRRARPEDAAKPDSLVEMSHEECPASRPCKDRRHHIGP